MDADFLLLCRIYRGDEDAIETFVRRYYPQILRYCRLHLQGVEEPEDVTQEVFARFFQALPGYRHYGKLANFLYVIAGNLCRDCRKKQRPIPMEELPETALEITDALDEKLDVARALGQLPPELREVAALAFCQELRQKDIARILGIGLPLVKYRIKRARTLLAAYLGEEERP